ncbi:lysophospholipid acyltransferase family protein [uncultured Sphaerochaeta sp.]|uniref:lysophospholipid acyltransferase family protein n=1 Tax=uncultured Sphaerochaeta sp. TaxID=886478 RepID=UPI002A0A12D0|nr:lysophospholipid acyltransferase family protein [uncultured Sphaerochaeta sp.]
MKPLSRFLHGIYRKVVKLSLQLNYDFQTWQETPLPTGPKIFCSNHFSSSDVHFVTTLMEDPLHVVIGPGYGIPVVGSFLHWTEQIKALSKSDRTKVVDTSVSYLKEGDSIYIFPEGRLNTQQQIEIFRPGIARIYLKNPVPIIPIGLIAPKRRVKDKHSKTAGRKMTVVSRNYYANIGKPMEFPQALVLAKTNQAEAEQMICDALKERVTCLINEIKTEKFWS